MTAYHKDEKKQNIPAKEKPASTEKPAWKKNPKSGSCGQGPCEQK